jgi:molybdopterin/thiamine biosynthesis adenylyltransferase
MESAERFELVAESAGWEQAIRQLLLQPGTVGVARLRRNRTSRCTELLISSLEVRTQLPRGPDFPPVADWAVVMHAAFLPSVAPADWIAQIQPRPAQCLAVAIVGIGRDQDGWDGAVTLGGRSVPLSALRVVGPGMIRADRDAEPPDADDDPATLERWSRARGALGDAVWHRLRTAHVALFGASRTGSNMAFLLAALGVRRLLLCDPDRLEAHNLDAMPGLTEQDVGRAKVEALAERLVQFRSDLFVQGLACSARDNRVVECIRPADLLVTCVDNDTPRLAAALLSNRLLKVHLDIGTGVTFDEQGQRTIAADIRLLVPGQGCVACVGGLADEEQARYELWAPPGSLQRRRRAGSWQEQRAGSLVTVNTMAAAFGVQLWLDLLAGQLTGSHWTRLRWNPGQGLDIQQGPVTGNPNCQTCGTQQASLVNVRPAQPK